jgi:hypothetical protein
MSRVLTGRKLVDSVRKRTMCPDDTSIFTDQDILEILNEEMDVQILEKLLTLHEEHLTVHEDVDRNEYGIYDIPYRSIGNKIRDVSLQSGNYTYELSQVSIGELSDYSNDIDSSGQTDSFYVESNQIKLINKNRSYDKVRFWYHIRPNVMTLEDESGVISSIINNNDGTITCILSSIGKNFNGTSQFDIVGKRSPNKIKAWDLSIEPGNYTSTNKTGSITFNIEDIEKNGINVGEIKVGDYVCLAEQSPVPNIPTELHPVLAQAAAIHILEALGDTEALKNAGARMTVMTNSIQTLIDDRVDFAPKKIKPRHGPLGESLGAYRRRRKGTL